MNVVTGTIALSENAVADLSFPENSGSLYQVYGFEVIVPRFANDRSANGYAALSVAINPRASITNEVLYEGDIIARRAWTAVSFNASGPVRINDIVFDRIDYPVDPIAPVFISDVRVIMSLAEPIASANFTYAIYYDVVKANRALLDAARERMYSPVQVVVS